MSSQEFLASSQISPSRSVRRKSRFTYKHLSQLALSSASCPLRVVAHIDLDAFYAQCEGVRLGIAEDQPLAVQVRQPEAVFDGRSLTSVLAMARSHRHKLSCQEVWPE